MLMEASGAEALRDFLAEAGFFHSPDIAFYLTTPTAQLMRMSLGLRGGINIGSVSLICYCPAGIPSPARYKKRRLSNSIHGQRDNR